MFYIILFFFIFIILQNNRHFTVIKYKIINTFIAQYFKFRQIAFEFYCIRRFIRYYNLFQGLNLHNIDFMLVLKTFVFA